MNGGGSIGGMATFLIEVHLPNARAGELERAVRTLVAARSRMHQSAVVTRADVVGLSREDGRLICLVEADSRDAAEALVSLALLPAGRIRQITHVTAGGLLAAGHPGGDRDARVESELVEDVGDVGLDGPLGQE
jgi:hypothetical protein